MKKEKLLEQLKSLQIPYALNLQQYDFQKIKFIVVGDNPGDCEVEENRYFVGPAGKMLRKRLSSILEIPLDNIEDQVAFFNKTIIHTNQTKGLDMIRRDHPEVFEQSQQICAQEILDLAVGDVQILIFGVSPIFKHFWLEISKSNNVLSFHHPSFGMLAKQLAREHVKDKWQFLSFGAREFQRNLKKICK